VKKEEEKRKRFMKDQRQKTIQRVKQYMEVRYISGTFLAAQIATQNSCISPLSNLTTNRQ